ncbi:uncharacterized protein LOC144084938 [Stigmatopora argus]
MGGRRTKWGRWRTSLAPTNTEKFSIKAEAIRPIVLKYFERILPAQWSLLAAGSIDSETQVILADMCTDITQKLCADTIRVIIPEFKEHIQSASASASASGSASGSASASAYDSAGPKMKLSVEGGGLNGAFASALSVPEQRSESSQKLDSLFKREITQRVSRTLSAAAGRLAPLIYVPGTFTKIEVLAKMVLLACGSLKVYLGKMAFYTKCLGACWKRAKASESGQCVFDLQEATQAVVEILRKWTDGEDESTSLVAHCDLQKKAAEIVETIINDLHYPESPDEGAARSPAPHFNLALIKDQLCDFFQTCVSPSDGDESSRRRHFLSFCQKKFDELTRDLQKVRCRCMRTQRGKKKAVAAAAPGARAPGAEAAEPPASDGDDDDDDDGLLDFQGIRSGLEDVFRKSSPPGADELQLEADEFSRELADKIYRFMTANRTAVRSDAVWRRYSEPLILEVDREKPENLHVLHRIVEDTSTKFVQQLLLWLKMEPVTRSSRADRVYGCLSDIDALVAGGAREPRNASRDSGGSPGSDDGSPASVGRETAGCCRRPRRETSAGSESSPDSESAPGAGTVAQSRGAPETDDGERSDTPPPSGPVREAWPSPLRSSSKAASKKKGRREAEVDVTTYRSPSVLEEMVTSLVAVLVARLLTRFQKAHKRAVLSRDTLPVIRRVSKKVLRDPRLRVIAEVDVYSAQRVTEAAAGELLRLFDRRLAEASLSDAAAFDDALLRELLRGLRALEEPPSSKSALFFSAARKAFCIPSRGADATTSVATTPAPRPRGAEAGPGPPWPSSPPV